MMKSALLRVIGPMLSLVLIFTLIASTTPARAAGTCDAPVGNYFDGFQENATNTRYYEGASAYIVVKVGAICSPAVTNNFTNAWVMITEYGGYGQVGFERTTGYPSRWFSQFRRNGSAAPQTKYSSFSINGEIDIRHAFRVLWQADCACLTARIDQYLWAYTSWNPFAEWGGYGDWGVQFSGEAAFLQSDMPGTRTAPTPFTALGGQRVDNDDVEFMPCILQYRNSNPRRWDASAASCTAFSIWTI